MTMSLSDRMSSEMRTTTSAVDSSLAGDTATVTSGALTTETAALTVITTITRVTRAQTSTIPTGRLTATTLTTVASRKFAPAALTTDTPTTVPRRILVKTTHAPNSMDPTVALTVTIPGTAALRGSANSVLTTPDLITVTLRGKQHQAAPTTGVAGTRCRTASRFPTKTPVSTRNFCWTTTSATAGSA